MCHFRWLGMVWASIIALLLSMAPAYSEFSEPGATSQIWNCNLISASKFPAQNFTFEITQSEEEGSDPEVPTVSAFFGKVLGTKAPGENKSLVTHARWVNGELVVSVASRRAIVSVVFKPKSPQPSGYVKLDDWTEALGGDKNAEIRCSLLSTGPAGNSDLQRL